MSFDLADLGRAVAAHGRVARVVIAQVHGSAPREAGAAMLVWEGGQSGTIGGGALEWEASKAAFDRQGATRHALGPSLGQCCGGAVTLWTEQFDQASLPAEETVYARGPGSMPLAVKRTLDRARAQGVRPETQIVQDWLIEPVERATTPLWIWGAGHVGRALVSVLAPLPDFSITWIDTAPDRFPAEIPANVTPIPAADPQRLVQHAPSETRHLILTFSHELDLALCHAVLRHGFGWAGLIGSDTKWARFQKRLLALGHTPDEISGICCPIGQKHLGKHPQSIAIGVAAFLLDHNKREYSACQPHCSASLA